MSRRLSKGDVAKVKYRSPCCGTQFEVGIDRRIQTAVMEVDCPNCKERWPMGIARYGGSLWVATFNSRDIFPFLNKEKEQDAGEEDDDTDTGARGEERTPGEQEEVHGDGDGGEGGDTGPVRASVPS